MAGEAIFDPQGGGFRQSAGVFGDAQSLMQRAAAADQQKQLFDIQRQQYDVERPVMLAKAQAQIADYGNQLAGDRQMNDLSAQAASEMPNIRQQWIDSMKIDDPATRLAVQDQVLGMAGKFASLKNVGPEIKTWHDVYATNAVNQRVLDQISGRLQQTAETNDMQLQKQQAAIAQAQAKLDNDTKIAELKAQHAAELQQMRDEAAKARGDTTAQTSTNNTQFNAEQKSAIEADRAALKAGESGNEDLADQYRMVARAHSAAAARLMPSSTTSSSSPAASPAPAVAPTIVAPDAKTVSVGGKDYPVFKDKSGNRAYLIDGHYVPIQSQ